MATTEVDEDGATSVFGGGEGLEYSKATPANSNYAPDDDGRIRRMAFKIDGLKTFPIAAAEKMLGHADHAAARATLAWIDYPGPPRTIPYISFDDVENGRLTRRTCAASSWSSAPRRRACRTATRRRPPAAA